MKYYNLIIMRIFFSFNVRNILLGQFFKGYCKVAKKKESTATADTFLWDTKFLARTSSFIFRMDSSWVSRSIQTVPRFSSSPITFAYHPRLGSREIGPHGIRFAQPTIPVTSEIRRGCRPVDGARRLGVAPPASGTGGAAYGTWKSGMQY